MFDVLVELCGGAGGGSTAEGRAVEEDRVASAAEAPAVSQVQTQVPSSAHARMWAALKGGEVGKEDSVGYVARVRLLPLLVGLP